MRRPLLGLLFLLSGAAALCYEVAWTRHLVLVFGNTTRAVALLLGAYMLGLALGSEFGGRLADRTRRPAALYGLFELAIAAFAVAFPWLVDAVRAVYLGIGTSAPPMLFVLAFVLLVVPTFCMGTTLPLLARATVADASKTGRDVGFLYAMNIVGAVIGAAGTGFVLMEAQGVLGATHVAAAVNAIVGVVGWLAFRGTGAGGGSVDGAEARADAGGVAGTPAGASADARGAAGTPAGAAGCAPTEEATSLRGTAPGAPAAPADPAIHLRRAALVAAFASGFVGLAAQVAWTRLLTFFLNGFTWTFSAILATFLAGLALGGWVFGRRASASRDPAKLLVRLLLAVAVASAAVLWALGRHETVTRAMWTAAGSLASDPHDPGARHIWMLVLSSAAVLLVPAFVMGGVFPVATSLYQRGLADLGARVGRLYAVNTLGCVLGSLVAGFLLQPALGPARAASVVAFSALAFALVVAWTGRVRVPAAWAIAAAAVFGIGRAAEPSKPWLLRSHVFTGDRARETELREERHGQVCTVSIVENTRERYRLLYTDEFQAAGTKPEYRYMRMLAHLPVALARDPSRALVICFGTGTTAGSVSAHSAVKTLDIVEISPEVLEVAGQFADVNRDVLRGAGRTDLGVRVHVDDGRHFVLRSGERWGVISLEPLMPYTPAAIHFYTRDFYAICASHLEPGGLVCQWIPLQAMSGEDFPKLVAAFVAVFPDSAMFFVDGAVALIGGPDGVELSFPRVAARLSDPAVAEDLRAIGFADPARALATFVSGGEKLREFAKDAEPVTDEHPVLEFHPIPPHTAPAWLLRNLVHMQEQRARWDRLPVVFGEAAPEAERAANDLVLALHSGNRVLEGMVALEASGFSRRAGRDAEFLENFQVARAAFAQAVALDPGNETARQQWEGIEREWQTLLGLNALRDGDMAVAERHFVRALEYRAMRQADFAWSRLAEARNRAGRAPEALAAACEATRLFPGGLEARAERAFARAALGDLRGASEDYHRALRGSGDLSALAPRLVPDADRARTAHPWPAVPPGDDARSATERVRAALAGDPSDGTKVPPRLRLRILAADLADAYDAAFAAELAPPAAIPDDGEALRHVATLRLAAPPRAAAAFRTWLAAGRPVVHDAAAEGLTETDPAAAADLLASPGQLPRTAIAALARAAAQSSDRRVVRPLIGLLRSRDAEVRRAAHRSLFALGHGEAPRLADLDTSDPDSAAYRRAVFDVESWWAREQERR